MRLVCCLLLLLLGTASISQSSYVDDGRRPFYYYRGRPMLSAAISSSIMANRVASSVVLPIYGNVYPRGFYYVPINVGEPAKPYFLDPDTGSDLTWLQCDAPCVRCTRAAHPLYRPSNDLIPARDPLCAAVQPEHYRPETPDQCDYEIEYADGGSSLGVLLKDAVPLNFTNGHRRTPRLAIGCGYDQIPGSSFHPLDGVLGLGKGRVSIVSQLSDQGLTRNVVGHCLSGEGGGYIFFGDDVYDPSRIEWTPMSRDYRKHYSPGFAELTFGRKTTGVENLVVVFDSGSSYTYFSSQAYYTLISLMTRELHRTSLKDAVDDDTLPVCWKGKKPFRSIRDVRKYFKPLALSFANGGRSAAHFDIPPENYLIVSIKGSVCLGILNGTEIGLQNYNIIGDISMQDRTVIYDNEKNMIGWGPGNCDRIPKGKASAA
uniref:Aspartic proteinase Asp1 n=3 Tax=Opuntia streptacantha TaxID=393608 RepID=A0A7C8ZDM8_OPUST